MYTMQLLPPYIAKSGMHLTPLLRSTQQLFRGDLQQFRGSCGIKLQPPAAGSAHSRRDSFLKSHHGKKRGVDSTKRTVFKAGGQLCGRDMSQKHKRKRRAPVGTCALGTF